MAEHSTAAQRRLAGTILAELASDLVSDKSYDELVAEWAPFVEALSGVFMGEGEEPFTDEDTLAVLRRFRRVTIINFLRRAQAEVAADREDDE